MTLSETAFLVDANPKWVINTLASLRVAPQYGVGLAKRLWIARSIVAGTGIPLTRAFAAAHVALRDWSRGARRVVLRAARGHDVALTIDVYRLLASFHVRLARLRVNPPFPTRGRPPEVARDPLEAARAWGLDLSLIADNMAKSPEQRLRQLDAMSAFSRNSRRVASTIG